MEQTWLITAVRWAWLNNSLAMLILEPILLVDVENIIYKIPLKHVHAKICIRHQICTDGLRFLCDWILISVSLGILSSWYLQIEVLFLIVINVAFLEQTY